MVGSVNEHDNNMKKLVSEVAFSEEVLVKELVSRENIVELVKAPDNKNNPNYTIAFLTDTTPSFNMSKEVANLFHYEISKHEQSMFFWPES